VSHAQVSRLPALLREAGLVSIVFVLISLAAWQQQTARWEPQQVGDAYEYYKMTRQFHAGADRVVATGPFVYRVAVPWVASFASAEAIEAFTPYYWINIPAAYLLALLLLLWLRRFVRSPQLRVLLVALYIVAWHAPARFVYFYPLYVDPPFLGCLLSALLLMDDPGDARRRARRLALLGVLLIGTMIREFMALMAVATVVSPLWRAREGAGVARNTLGLAWDAAPFVSVGVGLAICRSIGILQHPFVPWAEPLALLQDKEIHFWLLGWVFAFGPPVIAVVLAGGRSALDVFRGRPQLVVLMAGVVIGSFAGGTDTERIAAWGAPIVYAAAGLSLERLGRGAFTWPLLVVLAVAQAISARIFWPIPSIGYNVGPWVWSGHWQDAYEAFNRAVVIHTHYTYLWSYFGSRAFHGALFAYDAVFIAVLVWWMRRGAYRGRLTSTFRRRVTAL
jgi:hypothetical protein